MRQVFFGFQPGYAGVCSGATSALSDLPRPGRTPEPSNATAQIKLSENSGVKSTEFCRAQPIFSKLR